ncbi:M20 family metallo-hydrolase [Flavobacterium amniphilum]|uniref:M20 family metallo-hydrolase n=1 Tax=Flavobacterium amniphilum TaxID=1834035 RepID=UPI00202AB568|nr:M20 family metallo-hydrolase [Flavobacterium amniphilum]MCL9804105.1 M20 family metallo-hydrolase [Flavobacterium amniphilum]
MKQLQKEALELLQKLIKTESFSKQEDKTAEILNDFFVQKGIPTTRLLHNVWVKNQYFDDSKPTILLNSHHDTVKPNKQYTRDPFSPDIEDGILYGLGSNDAGGPLVSLAACFLHFYDRQDLQYNLVYAATAEEEISGNNGVEIVLPQLGDIYFGIVGEPTKMDIAIAEKGLFVIDCVAHGKSGHAAREEGENAIYKALAAIEWFRTFEFPEVSEMLGKVKMSVTIINAGVQHNVVPESCQFTVDIRTTDKYNNEQALAIIKQHVDCEVIPRSTRLNPSFAPKEHPIVQSGIALGRAIYASPTTSDQALMNGFPTFKMGPGDSARSHTANEYIYVEEINKGIEIYIEMLEKFNETDNETVAKYN